MLTKGLNLSYPAPALKSITLMLLPCFFSSMNIVIVDIIERPLLKLMGYEKITIFPNMPKGRLLTI
jgi:hypothetical protein